MSAAVRRERLFRLGRKRRRILFTKCVRAHACVGVGVCRNLQGSEGLENCLEAVVRLLIWVLGIGLQASLKSRGRFFCPSRWILTLHALALVLES